MVSCDGLRLLYVTNAFPWPRAESFLIPEIESLARAGHDLYILPTRLFEPPLELPIKLQGLATLIAWPLTDPRGALSFLTVCVTRPRSLVRILFALFGSGPRKGMKNLAVLPKSIRVARLARQLDIDHVHAHWGGTSSTLAFVVHELTGTPWSMTLHSWDVPEDNLLALKAHSARFSRFISEKRRKEGIALGAPPHKSPLLRVGVQLPRIAPAATWDGKGTFRILCAAAFVEFKGHRHLIDALVEMRAAGRDVHLTLAGEGHLRNAIASQAEKLGGAVEFLGHVPHATLIEWLREGRFHISVLTSIVDSTGLEEGVPVSLIEAMSCGVPAVATRTGSIAELIPEASGLLVPPGDPAALTSAITALIDSPARHERAAREAIAIVEREYDIEQIAGSLTARMTDTPLEHH